MNMKLSIDAEPGDTDDVLRSKAKTQVNFVLRRMGEMAGATAWENLEITLKGTERTKETFLREAGEKMVSSATRVERQEIEDSIFRQLREQRDR